MLDISKAKDFTDYLYSRLPFYYRLEDEKQKNFLYNYLYALVLGGYNVLVNSQYKTLYYKQYNEAGELITEKIGKDFEPILLEKVMMTGLGIKDLPNLFNPMTCPEDLFPYLYESFGLSFMHDINIKYQRRFLCNIGFMNSMKGSLDEAQFIASVLTGMTNDAEYERDKAGNRWLRIILYAKDVKDIENVETDGKIVEKFLKTRIPFYLNPDISVKILSNYLPHQWNYAAELVLRKGYKLYEKEV